MLVAPPLRLSSFDVTRWSYGAQLRTLAARDAPLTLSLSMSIDTT